MVLGKQRTKGRRTAPDASVEPGIRKEVTSSDGDSVTKAKSGIKTKVLKTKIHKKKVLKTTKAKVDTNEPTEEEHSESMVEQKVHEEEPQQEEINCDKQDETKTSSKPALKSLHATAMSFATLGIQPGLVNTLDKQGFRTMTDIQLKVIPKMVEGKSVVASATTGSGKTLSFLVPAVNMLLKLRPRPSDGTIVLIICPTRELAIQTHRVASGLLGNASAGIHCGLLIGGSNRKRDVEAIARGCSLLVATPGRLLDHLENTREFNVSELRMLVLDEADHILDIGYADDMKSIGDIISKRASKTMINGEKLVRQNALFSATVTEKIKGLVREIFSDINTKNVEYITTYDDVCSGAGKKSTGKSGVDSGDTQSGGEDRVKMHTAECIEQGYCICPAEKRFRLLYTFLRMYGHKSKIIVFLSTCSSVRFHTDVLCYVGVPCVCVHGSQHQMKRTEQLDAFSKAETGVLLCTPLCARGLDIPNVSWIVQYDAPGNTAEYTHRVGRTGRMVANSGPSSGDGLTDNNGIDVHSGRTLIILQPSETSLIYILKKEGVPLTEFSFPESKLLNVQRQYEKVVTTNPHLYSSAREAFKSFYNAYTTHQLTAARIYDPSKLELGGLAHAFGLEIPPSIDYSIALRKRKSQRSKRT